MAKKATTKTAPADAAAAAQAARDEKYSREEQRSYVEAVIRKQAQLDDEAAAKRADELSPEHFAALHDAGREGRVSDCRELLGLE